MKPKKTQITYSFPKGSPRRKALRIRVLKDQLRNFLAELESLEEINRLDTRRGLNLYEEVRRLEIELIRFALQQTGGHQRRAASLLNLRPTTLHAKIKLYGLHTGFDVPSTKEKRSE